MPRAIGALAALAALAGCVAKVKDPRGSGACDPSQYAHTSLETVASDFATNVQPLLNDGTNGCVACHGTSSGRNFIVYPDASQTFHRALTADLLSDHPGSLLARLQATDTKTRMPLNAQPWPAEKVAAVSKIACELQGVLGGDGGSVVALDEQFPPDLLAPYTGPSQATYDNTFLNYKQLKGKVHAIFNDDWVRSGTDKFAANIGLFGGADFQTHYVEARVATPEFLLALDSMSKDVCSQGAQKATGPFAGLNTTQSIVDSPASTTVKYEAENSSQMIASTGQVEGTVYDLYTNGSLSLKSPYTLPGDGSYTFTMRARGTQSQSLGPDVDLLVGGKVVKTFTNVGTTLTDYTFTTTLTAGPVAVSLNFTNDSSDSTGDRNLYVDYLTIAGPAGSGTGTTLETATRNGIKQLYRKILFREASSAEVDATYAMMKDLRPFNLGNPDLWSGACESLLHHPDFLFTLPPSRATATGTDNKRLLLVKVAQDLVARPPTDAEFERFASGASLDDLVDGYLQSTEFRDYFFYKMRIRTESDGSTEADEPARLWVYLMTHGDPFHQLLTGDFDVDPSFNKQPRSANHGETGLLTMPGYLQHKQGLPHYNYSARVLSDFMGYVFEVPDSVIQMRLGATAASTVDPTSICFNCHKLLTPLAYQRQKWLDDGGYTEVDANGKPIDDSDQNMVAGYPYAGHGLAAFSAQAVKKERFIRHTLDAEYQLLMGRPMRFDADEREMYKRLWDLTQSGNGDLRAPLKAIIDSPAYQNPPNGVAP